ncbi:hypothetical protein PPERSA_07264 [Pseudocohnilembus persalinus]|uniref:SET domain-containing protein n=1 Tax=Pseudocohnilembus persalinus TaxID=266149 RepID=A0A0V0QCX4_PSEPJ|nr:hypothetical protein PPERSA_07264 [Pseudocohnilembus persalinus]|eukprot:KRX00067.1 hypothetical protein PPERSA_07264 [Pseudocohnilembus persalinus]
MDNQNNENINIKNTIIVEDSDYLDLEIKQSNIPNSGDGLFVKKNFEKDEVISEYRGKIIDSKYCNHAIYDYEDKMVWVNEQYCIIGNNIASKANDIIDFNLKYYNTNIFKKWVEEQQFPTLKNLSYNAEFYLVKNKAFIKATRDIQNGEEVYLSYGFDYWKHFYDIYSNKK